MNLKALAALLPDLDVEDEGALGAAAIAER